MDMSSAFSTQSSDSEFCHISSPEATSPASFMDFSPSAQLQNTSSSTSAGAKAGSLLRDGSHSRRRRCKKPSKQRQSASEKEKLRMRDLTKALHHLRTYLPASVAPAGQTLTKFETLRLTIRYISYLSAQLGLSEESLRASESPLNRGYSTTESQSTFRSSQNIRTEIIKSWKQLLMMIPSAPALNLFWSALCMQIQPQLTRATANLFTVRLHRNSGDETHRGLFISVTLDHKSYGHFLKFHAYES